jgi:chromosome partitioning protein
MSIAAVLNQKGGVGKTTVTLGLASAAWAAGKRVLVVDLDPQASSTWALGIDPAEVHGGVTSALKGKTAQPVESAWGDTVHVLPMKSTGGHPPPEPDGKKAELKVHDAIGAFAANYDLVLLDCSPSLGVLTHGALAAADAAVVVAEPAALSIRGLSAVMDAIDDVWNRLNPRLDLAGVIVNRVPPLSSEADLRLDELAKLAGRKAIWEPYVPQRVIIAKALAERWPLHSYGAKATDPAAVFDALLAKLMRSLR